jgi:hypothetical protein
MIDIHILPRKAQNELIDFHQFLVERYAGGKNKRGETSNTTAKLINRFFDGYDVDLTDFNFNRSELYDR